jgi:tRNA(Arg) A34 adenosine deaminase TadA
MDKFMQIANQEARAARDAGDYPYGAVLVRAGEIVGVGRNQENSHNDPTSHAEMEALRAAGLQKTYADTVMYASAFPCIMCAGPIVMLGVPELIVGASWPGYETSRDFLQSHGVKISILELEECKQLLVDPNVPSSTS